MSTEQTSRDSAIGLAGTGPPVTAGPWVMRIIEDGSRTSGRHAVVEFTLNGQFSPPPHIHHGHEEVIYVLEGEMALQTEDETFRLGPGDAFVTPIGLPHTFSNGSAAPLRFLLTISPAAHLGYFTAMADAIREAHGAPTPQAMMAVMQRYQLEPLRSA